MQLLCLKVTARYLGFDCGLKLGRQAAWRPGGLGSSRLVAALCMQLLCLKVTARALCGLVVKLLGGRVFWFGVVTVHAVAVFKSDCEVLV